MQNSKTENIPIFFITKSVILEKDTVKKNNGMENLINTEENKKIIRISHKTALAYLIKTCELPLKDIVKTIRLAKKLNPNKKIHVLMTLDDILKYSMLPKILNNKLPNRNDLFKSKQLIENLCLCLESIAKNNGNRFIFRNLDVCINSNKTILSRLALKLCYEILYLCKQQSAIQVLSYITTNNFILEFITVCSKKINKSRFKQMNPLLKMLNANLTYEKLDNNEFVFRLTMPF